MILQILKALFFIFIEQYTIVLLTLLSPFSLLVSLAEFVGLLAELERF